MNRWLGIMASVVLVGCTSSAGDPLEPLPGSGGEVVLGEYPTEPKGAQVGSVITNLAFDGYVNSRDGIGASRRETIRLSDFYNPDGDGVFEVGDLREAGTPKPTTLFVTVGAMYCGPCQEEALRLLPRLYDELGPRRLEILSVLAQSHVAGEPATFDDLDTWCSSYDVGYPAVIDPAFQLGQIVDGGAFPGMILIDTTTMRIVEVSLGAPDEGYIETRLHDLLSD